MSLMRSVHSIMLMIYLHMLDASALKLSDLQNHAVTQHFRPSTQRQHLANNPQKDDIDYRDTKEHAMIPTRASTNLLSPTLQPCGCRPCNGFNNPSWECLKCAAKNCKSQSPSYWCGNDTLILHNGQSIKTRTMCEPSCFNPQLKAGRVGRWI